MANETIGTLAHHCGTTADVRKNKKGKLYLMCPNCGQLAYNLPGGQDYILNHAAMNGAKPAPESVEKIPLRNVTESNPVDVTEEVEIVTIKEPKPEPAMVTADDLVTEPEDSEKGDSLFFV